MEKLIGFGPAGVDWHERINFPRMREERSAKVKSLMKKNNIPVLLLYDLENIRYATGKRTMTFQAMGLEYSLFFAEADPIVHEHADKGIDLKKNSPWLRPDNIRSAYTWMGGLLVGPQATRIIVKKWVGALKDDLKRHGRAKGPLGIDVLDPIGKEALREAGVNTVDCKALMMEARRVKNEDEINCL